MKTIISWISVIFLLSVIINAQTSENRRYKNRAKLDQLEKVKLIEALDLSEESAVRFFARRNDFKKEIDELENKSDDVFNELEKTLNYSDNNNETQQKKLINDLLMFREKIEIRKKEFLNSLNDLLTVEQISKYIIFERKFRDEIRKVLLKRRDPHE
jgi:hypothetical protein